MARQGYQRLTVDQAATTLGISTDAVRKRARRGSLDSEKDEDGTVYIWVDSGVPDGLTPTQAHLDSLQEQINYLREHLDRAEERDRENRRIIAALTQRIPAIEESSETRGTPESASEGGNSTSTPPEQEEASQSRSWLHRFFFGPG